MQTSFLRKTFIASEQNSVVRVPSEWYGAEIEIIAFPVKTQKQNANQGSSLVISFQVINEVCRILKKKDFTEEKLKFVISNLTKICEVHQSTVALSFKASELRENHDFSFWDSHIVAHAIDAECDLLISEDMQDGHDIDGTIIKNIFLKEPRDETSPPPC